jgi:uncharacterized membrane protein
MSRRLIQRGRIPDSRSYITNSVPDRKQTDTFTLFPELLTKLYLMIWEHTWPAPQIIEESFCFTKSSETNYTILHPGGSLSMELKNLGWRILEEELFKKCSEPIALYVCHESQMHTLRKYAYIKHADSRTILLQPLP